MKLLPGQYIDPAHPDLVFLSPPVPLDVSDLEQLRLRGYVVVLSNPTSCELAQPAPASDNEKPGPQGKGE